jgi:type II secretory pathway pseudopilin PulG
VKHPDIPLVLAFVIMGVLVACALRVLLESYRARRDYQRRTKAAQDDIYAAAWERQKKLLDNAAWEQARNTCHEQNLAQAPTDAYNTDRSIR